jgi:hypothetical protein
MHDLAQTWHHLPTVGKVLVIGVPVILVFLFIKSRSGNSSQQQPFLFPAQDQSGEPQGVPDTSQLGGASGAQGATGSGGQPAPIFNITEPAITVQQPDGQSSAQPSATASATATATAPAPQVRQPAATTASQGITGPNPTAAQIRTSLTHAITTYTDANHQTLFHANPYAHVSTPIGGNQTTHPAPIGRTPNLFNVGRFGNGYTNSGSVLSAARQPQAQAPKVTQTPAQASKPKATAKAQPAPQQRPRTTQPIHQHVQGGGPQVRRAV